MAPKSERDAMVKKEVEAQRIATWLLVRVPTIENPSSILETLDSEAGQQFLEAHGEELAQRLMRIGERLGHERASFAHGVGLGMMIVDQLKRGQIVPPIDEKLPTESDE